jgi:hypothetical protein
MLIGSVPPRAVEWIRVHMSTQNEGASRALNRETAPGKVEKLPKPPMLWLLIVIALLALLAFSSRG